MKSKLPALLAAFLITAVIALSMAVVGVNALVNPNSTGVSNSPAATPVPATTGVSADQASLEVSRARVLAGADIVIPGHGAPFRTGRRA